MARDAPRFRLSLVACRNPPFRGEPPIARTMRAPLDQWLAGGKRQGPADVLSVIADEEEVPSGAQRSSQLVECIRLQDATSVVTPLWPGIGKQDRDPAKASVLQRAHQAPGIICQHADTRKHGWPRTGEQSCHSVDPRLAADEADGGMQGRLPKKMFSRPETDLQPNLREIARKKAPRVDGLSLFG